MSDMNKVSNLMDSIKNLTVFELVEFCKEFDAYKEDVINALGGNLVTNNNTAKESKNAKESKTSRHANKSKKDMLCIDKENGFKEGFKAGDETCEDDTILTCAKTNCNTVVGGQAIINNIVCNYSYYVQFGKAIVYSNDITKAQLEELEENIYDEIPSGVRVFDAVPNNCIESPTYDDRWYYDELEEGNFIFSNPNGSYIGYTNGYAFIIRESGFMESVNMNYVFGKSWKKPSDELKDSILSLKDRAFGEDNNKPKKTNTKKVKSKHNRNIPINKTPQKKVSSVPNRISENKLHEAAKMQRLDLSMLNDD